MIKRHRTGKHLDALSPRDLRYNFILGVVNGAVFNISEVFIDAEMVLTWFLAQLGVSNFLIGLVLPIRQCGWFFPQIFASDHVQRLPRKLPFYQTVGLFRIMALLALALGTALLPMHSLALRVVFFMGLTAYSLGSGLAGLTFLSMLQRVIPPARRGAFFAQRMFWGGVLALGASSLVGVLLDEPPGLAFPKNFVLMFTVCLVAFVLTVLTWSWIKEPPEVITSERLSWIAQVKRGARLLRVDRAYRTFVLARLCLMLAQLAAPFYIVYAKEVLKVPARMAGVYLTARTAASIFSNLLWGRISDRVGNRRVIRLTNLVGLCIPLLALIMGGVAHSSPSSLTWLAYPFTLVFVASGAFSSGSAIGNMNYLLDLAPSDQRALYLGFTNTLFGIGILTSSLGGLIVDWAGFATVMGLALCFYGVAVVFSLALSEPRAAG